MFRLGKRHPVFFAGCVLLVALLASTVIAAVPVSNDLEQLLRQADSVSNNASSSAQFAALMRQLDADVSRMTPEEKLYLTFLKGWRAGYLGDYSVAIPMLDVVIKQSADPTLRIRAGATAVNVLGNASNYEEAFARLRPLLNQLPQVTDKSARSKVLGVATQLYIEAGQYGLASDYAGRLIKENPIGRYACIGITFKLQALYKSGSLHSLGNQFQEGIDTCNAAKEPVYANGIRYFVANFYLQHGQTGAAIKLLQENYEDVRATRYRPLISLFDVSLAQAYWNIGNVVRAKQFALNAIDNGVQNEYTEPLVTAYGLLYQFEKKQGDLASALDYHEKYMAADKGYLNVVSAKALAYQIVNQQVLAKKQQIDALSKQNQILMLRQSLDRKAAETSRLYIILLLTVLAFIALLTYRIKHSQLRFMKLARRDGLTGIYNRQHFLAEAERELQYCRKSARDACLVLIDLDHFKDFNDTYGHATGDRVLLHAVQSCQAHLRSTDIFGRLGGEEFGVLLPECTLAQVTGRVEQLRVAIATVADADVLDVVVSASFGVAATACSGYELRELLMHADDALYQAKNTGRNRVVVFDKTANQARETLRKSRVGTPAAAQPNA